MKAQQQIKIGDGVATIKSAYSSNASVVDILGIEKSEATETVYLNALVHQNEDDFEGWTSTGAISTILSRNIAAE